MNEASDWTRVRELGSGGQSTVFLVRNPTRTSELQLGTSRIQAALSQTGTPNELIAALRAHLRTDRVDELGALKVFDKVRDGGAPVAMRISREIAILGENYPNLPKLLNSNVRENWMITEYFPEGTLEGHQEIYQGQVLAALRAFRSLTETIAFLHRQGVVHRDIKPANIFIAGDKLVPGDFGIAHLDLHPRVTATNERVGPRDYMPQWADTGVRLEDVKSSSDVYMLGKLLWCMLSGKTRLPREYHRKPQYDLSVMFPDDIKMNLVNALLDKCLVEDEGRCLPSAVELLDHVQEAIASLDRGMLMKTDGSFDLPCLVCRRGSYRELTKDGRGSLPRESNQNMRDHPIFLRVFSCDVCTHYTFFAPGFPEEAIKRGWKKQQ